MKPEKENSAEKLFVKYFKMSRLGKKKLIIPSGVEVSFVDNVFKVKGQKGTLDLLLNKSIDVLVNENEIEVKQQNVSDPVTWGLSWALIKTMLEGVSKGFEKKLEINGVGYRAQVQGKKIVLSLGFSHPVEMEAPEGIEYKVKENIITISGCDKQKVGEMAAQIRAKRKPEPYKGKGIKYVGEQIRRKAGKKAASS